MTEEPFKVGDIIKNLIDPYNEGKFYIVYDIDESNSFYMLLPMNGGNVEKLQIFSFYMSWERVE